MPEKTSTSSPCSRRRSCSVCRATRLVCAPGLPDVSLSLARESSTAQPRHIHDSLVLGVVTAGARCIEAPGGKSSVTAGEIFVLPPGRAHACAPQGGPCSYMALSIAATSLPEDYPAALPLHIRDDRLAECLARLAEALEAPAGSLERQSLLAEVLERLATHGGPGTGGIGPDASTEPDVPGAEALAGAVRQARRLLEQNLDSGLDLSALAEACGIGPFALHRAFTQALGLPPHAFQTHVRLRQVKALLRTGATPVDAALASGFCDQSHMHRHFTRLVGLTPAQYARAHANGKRVG